MDTTIQYSMTIFVYSNNNNNDLRIIDYDIIIKALIYKQLNPPQYRTYTFDRGYLGTVLSKAVSLIYDVQGIGKIHQHFVYDIKNNIVKYKFWYLSEKKRKEIEKKIKKEKMLRKARYKHKCVEDK